MTLGQRAVDASLRRIRRDGPNLRGALGIAVITMLLFGVVTQALGIEAVLGAFVAGVVLNRSRFQQHEVEHTHRVAHQRLPGPGVLRHGRAQGSTCPFLGEGEALAWAGARSLAVAIVAKFAGGLRRSQDGGTVPAGRGRAGRRAERQGRTGDRDRLGGPFARGCSARPAYTVIVIVPLVTSVFAAVSLAPGGAGLDGIARRAGAPLEREEALSRNLVVRSSRLLLPSRAEPGLHRGRPVDALRVAGAGARDRDLGDPRQRVGRVVHLRRRRRPLARHHRRPQRAARARGSTTGSVRVASGAGAVVAAAVVAEARLGYGAICVGVAGRHEGQLYSPPGRRAAAATRRCRL